MDLTDTHPGGTSEGLLPLLLTCSNSPSKDNMTMCTILKKRRGTSSIVNSDDDEEPRLWSQNPVVNALATHLIVQHLHQRKRQQEGAEESVGDPSTLDTLVGSALSRLEQPEKSNEKKAQNCQKNPALSAKNVLTKDPSIAPTSGGNGKEAFDGTSVTVSESDSERVERTIAPSDAKTEEESDDDSSQSTSNSTRQELALALQQHLNVLQKRGQASEVIPSFFALAKAPPQAEEMEEDSQVSSDVDSTEAVRSIKRRRLCTARDRYYQDLGAELVSSEPVPETIALGVDPAGAHKPKEAADAD